MKKVSWFYEEDYERFTVYFDLPDSFKCDYIVLTDGDPITDLDLDESEEQQEFNSRIREAISSAEEYGTWENCDENDWDYIAGCADYWFGHDPKEETLFEAEGIRVYVKHGILREEDDAYTYACEDTPENRQAYIADAKETVKEWAR